MNTPHNTNPLILNQMLNSRDISWNDLKDKPFYTEMEETTVEAFSETPLDGFPVFTVGDTVTVKVDGVEHSLVAFEDVGVIVIGDSSAELQSGNGVFGWAVICFFEGVVFFSSNSHTVTYKKEIVHEIDAKYLPSEVFADIEERITSVTDEISDIYDQISYVDNSTPKFRKMTGCALKPSNNKQLAVGSSCNINAEFTRYESAFSDLSLGSQISATLYYYVSDGSERAETILLTKIEDNLFYGIAWCDSGESMQCIEVFLRRNSSSSMYLRRA